MTPRRPQTVGFTAGERNVFLHVLTGCNLSCRHCYINPREHGGGMLSLAQIETWLGLFVDSARRSNVVFLGGEPTMHPDLVAAIAAAKEMGYAVTVDTNGFLFHDFLTRVDPAHLDYLSFSLDGPDAETNDPIRGEGVFAVCTANARKAADRGIRTSLIYTVSSANIDQLAKMVPLLAELRVSRFFIQVIGLRGKSAQGGGSDGGLQVDPDRWLAVVPRVAEAAAEQGITVIYPKVYLDADEPFTCAGTAAENFFVFPNGRVYQCPLCEDYPVHSYEIVNDELIRRDGLTERRFFDLDIAEGCVMNRLLQPDTIIYDKEGTPRHRISCCLLKQRVG